MLMAVKKNLELMGAYFKLNLSAAMEYRTSFLLQVFGMILNNASFAFFWWLLFDRVGQIRGYGYKEVMLLWALASSSFGLCFIFFGNVRRLVEIIIRGELDAYLLQPKNVLLNVIASKTVVSAWGDLAYGLILFFVIRGLDLIGFGFFALFMVSGALMLGAVLITFCSLAFHYGNVQSVATLVFEFMITLSIYPETIFVGRWRFLIFTLFPAGFLTMYPVKIIQNPSLGLTLLVLGVTAVWIYLAFFTFFKGLKKYESGNLVVQKL